MEGESERKKKSGEAEEEEEKEGASTKKKQQRRERGLLSRIWKGIFRPRGDDFEKRLQHISKEEAAVLSRIKRRSLTWRRMVRHLLLFSAIFEIIAVGYAIMTTRSLDVVNWKARALRVLPMFVLPALSFASYSALVRFTRMCDRKDRKTLERLQAERQAKIDELKERTNYYITQQLIQRYDPDPAAKAAAATVLASKLGADSGLKVFVGDESQSVASTGKSNDVELVQSSGLRNRKDVHTRSSSEPSPMSRQYGVETPRSTTEDDQLVVDHYHPEGPAMHNGGWMARLAALLVGEDPTQSYALICGNCHMHNGLARKEDFPYIKYYCPHCRALNQSKQSGEHVSGSASPEMSTLRMTSGVDMIESPAGSVSNSVVTNGSPVAADTVEAPEKAEMKNIAAKE